MTNMTKIIRRLIIIGMCLFAPLAIKLGAYWFHKPGGSIFLKHNKARADIIDSNGVLLATTIPTKSVYIIPSEVIEKSETIINEFAPILNVSKEYLNRKLHAKSRKFVWIVRHIAPWQAYEIAKLGYSGVYVAKDSRRFYPLGAMFNHIVGRVDDDNNGLSGVEKSFNEVLTTRQESLKLSLKVPVQAVLKEILDEGKKEFEANAVYGMIICAKTGKILASYSQLENVDENPHENYKLDGSCINLNTQSVFEYGSVLKFIAAAMFLENKVVTLSTRIAAPAQLKLGKFTIKDVNRTWNCEYSFQEAFVKSSNVVFGTLASRAGLKNQLEFFHRCGFFDHMTIDNMTVVDGIFPKKWGYMNCFTATYGYGLAITAAHYIRGALRVLTGHEHELHILDDYKGFYAHENKLREEEGRPILNCKVPDLSKKILSDHALWDARFLLRQCFKASQMAAKYELEGYNIGGKTGTANNRVGGGKKGYKEKCNRCSYTFAIPANNPQIIGFIVIDEPKPSAKTFGWATAGWTAAPLGFRLMARLIPILNLKKEPVIFG